MSTKEEVNILGISLTLKDLIGVSIWSGELVKRTRISHYENNLLYDGCLEHSDKIAVRGDGGECYVYVWKHAFGRPFYVGSGKGGRWLNKNRKPDFLKHIDMADAIVYKVLTNVDRKTAYECEKFVSLLFTLHEVELSNKDNNAMLKHTKITPDEFERMLEEPIYKEIKSVVLNRVLGADDLPYEAALGQEEFKKHYGNSYFSNLYSRTA